MNLADDGCDVVTCLAVTTINGHVQTLASPGDSRESMAAAIVWKALWNGEVCVDVLSWQSVVVSRAIANSAITNEQQREPVQVTGPVKFAHGVSIKGKVVLSNTTSEPQTLMAGEYADVEVDVAAPAAVPA